MFLSLDTSTQKLYSDGCEPIFTGVFRTVGARVLGDNRNHHFYRRLTEAVSENRFSIGLS
jgi:hypothetical protein